MRGAPGQVAEAVAEGPRGQGLVQGHSTGVMLKSELEEGTVDREMKQGRRRGQHACGSLWVYSRESQREKPEGGAGHIHKGIRGRRQTAHTLESEGGRRPFTGSIKGKRQDVHRKNQREDTSRSQEKPEGGGKITLRRIRGRR